MSHITYIVLQCVAVCCSVLQCAVLHKRDTEAVMNESHHMYCVAVCCSVLQCVAVCCIVLQCVVHKGDNS